MIITNWKMFFAALTSAVSFKLSVGMPPTMENVWWFNFLCSAIGWGCLLWFGDQCRKQGRKEGRERR